MLIFKTYQGRKIRLLPILANGRWRIEVEIDDKRFADPQPEGYALEQLAVKAGFEAAVEAIDEEESLLHPW